MKTTIFLAALLVSSSPAFAEKNVAPLTLEEKVARSAVIVVAKPRSLEGMRYSKEVFEWTLETDLLISAVLKGRPSKPLRIHWVHHPPKGVEPYPLDQEMIWLLERRKNEAHLFAVNDCRKPLSMKKEIESILAKQRSKQLHPNHSLDRPAAR